jgi:hypothetical protein
LREGAHDGLDTPDFLSRRKLVGAGTRRLASNIYNVGARCEERPTLANRALGIEPLPAVREAVGGDIEDAHDEGAIEFEPGPRRPLSR